MSAVPVIAAGTFYPKSLFVGSVQGVWYDPSDLTTMFEDSAGTTAVHTPGNGTADSPIGKILDKSGNGNHATQSTSTARPTLSAKYNQLTYSEQLDNAAWTKTSMTATDGATDPNGGSTAETLVATAANGTVTQSFTAVATDYTFSVYLKRKTGTGNIDISCNSGGTWVTKTITSSWAQYSVTQTLTAGSKTPGIRIVTNGDEVYAWGADIRATNDGVGLPVYQRIADANTYDSTGFPYYIKFDGVDDFLTAGNVCNLGSADGVTTVGGWKCTTGTGTLYAKSIATGAAGRIAFLRDATNVLTGLFGVTIFTNFAVTYGDSETVKPLVITNVLNRTVATNALRRDGALLTTATTSAISGTFTTTYRFLVGAYNNSTDTGQISFLNGRIYGLIHRIAVSTATEIANTETWLNTKTKAY